MIRHVNEPVKSINPSGSSSSWVSVRHPSHRTILSGSGQSLTSTPEIFEEYSLNGQACRPASSDKNRRRLSNPGPISCNLCCIKVNTILISL